MARFEESGMVFEDDDYFQIDNSELHRRLRQNIKMADFLLLKKKGKELWIIEAKSSSPRLRNQPRFDQYIEEIQQKMVNALSLTWAVILKRHGEVGKNLPANFAKFKLSTGNVKFILIINGHLLSWLPSLQDALKVVLNATIKTWNFSTSSVVVLNQELAKKHGLIQEHVDSTF